MALLKNLLIVIPHSSLKRPFEIKKNQLSVQVESLINQENDWGTDKLYDFRKILGNKQIVFHFNQVFINACRHPKILDDCVPLKIHGKEIYKKGFELSNLIRKKLIKKYLLTFYKKIRESKRTFILAGHSFVAGTLDPLGIKMDYDIILSNFV